MRGGRCNSCAVRLSRRTSAVHCCSVRGNVRRNPEARQMVRRSPRLRRCARLSTLQSCQQNRPRRATAGRSPPTRFVDALIWVLGPWALVLGPWGLGPWALVPGPWALGPWTLGPGSSALCRRFAGPRRHSAARCSTVRRPRALPRARWLRRARARVWTRHRPLCRRGICPPGSRSEW